MFKSTLLAGLIFSLEAQASSCMIKNIDDLTLMFSNSPQEKSYQAANLELIEKTRLKNTLKPRPELSASFDADKSEFKNNELGVSLLFNIDEWRKYSLQKNASSAEADYRLLESKNLANERINESTLSYFKIIQNSFFNRKIDSLLQTVKSSEDVYNRRAIKGRDDEIVLNSLRLVKDGLTLKKAMLEDQIESDQVAMSTFQLPECEIQFEALTAALNDVDSFKPSAMEESHSLKLQELKLKEQFILKSADFESKNKISNFKIGPTYSREVVLGVVENRFGLGLSMDFPVLNNREQSDFTESTKSFAVNETTRQRLRTINQHNFLINRLKKYKTILKQVSSSSKAETHITKLKKSFDMGVISPLVYLDSYRSYVDYLETSQEAQLKVVETYLKLRGAYVENSTH